MAKKDKQSKKNKNNRPVSPLLAGLGLGLAWAALHAPVNQPQIVGLLVWLLQAAAAGILASAAVLLILSGAGFAVSGMRLLWHKMGIR